MATRKYPSVGRSDTKLAVPINKRHNCNTWNWLHTTKVSASNDITVLCHVINSIRNFNELGISNNNICNPFSSHRLVPWSITTLTQMDRKTQWHLYTQLMNCRQHTQITLQSERHVPPFFTHCHNEGKAPERHTRHRLFPPHRRLNPVLWGGGLVSHGGIQWLLTPGQDVRHPGCQWVLGL